MAKISLVIHHFLFFFARKRKHCLNTRLYIAKIKHFGKCPHFYPGITTRVYTHPWEKAYRCIATNSGNPFVWRTLCGIPTLASMSMRSKMSIPMSLKLYP